MAEGGGAREGHVMPSAADLPCVGDAATVPQASQSLSQIDLASLARERHERQRQRDHSESSPAYAAPQQGVPVSDSFQLPSETEQKSMECDQGDRSQTIHEVVESQEISDEAFEDDSISLGDVPRVSEQPNDQGSDNDDGLTQHEMSDEEDKNDIFLRHLKQITEEKEVRPALVLQNTGLLVRLEKRDFLKVRKTSPFLKVGAERVAPNSEAQSEPFYRIKATAEQATIGFDTRSSRHKWVPMPLALFGGLVLIDSDLPFIFLASKSTTCKVAETASRTYPTRGAVKFEVENNEPNERFLNTLIEKVHDVNADATQSPSAGLPPAFFAMAMNTILNNPNHKMNQLGGGTILVQAPANTIRLRLDVSDTLNVNEVTVLAWTQGIKFQFTNHWFRRRSLTTIRGPGTVWISASHDATNEASLNSLLSTVQVAEAQ